MNKKIVEWTAETAPCPFNRDDFHALWVVLLKMPKWAKKPLSAIQMSCTRLKRFDIDFAAMLVENSIEGNYQGVVFPDTEQRFELWKIKNNQQNGRGNQNLRESVNKEFAARDYNNKSI